jgi:thymidylate synthase (FAD)
METKTETLSRVSSPELDKILGVPLKVLDDGFVRVVDYMGTDESIVQAARVSYGKGTKTKSNDRELIRYLMRHKHTSPFEMCEIKFHIRVPMDTWRQWIRHRTANVNEYSTRYSVAVDSTYKTAPDAWRMQATVNKQGSGGFFDASAGEALTKKEAEIHQACVNEYKRRIEMGVAREQARKDLPLATYTEAYWKIDLGNLLHFLALRMEKKAQLEIRTYSELIGNEIVKKWCPFAWEAFTDYVLDTFSLSKIEQKILISVSKNAPNEAIELAKEAGLITQTTDGYKRSFECGEIEEKLASMGLSIPWSK